MEVHPIPIKSECLTLLRLYEGSAHSEEHLTENVSPALKRFGGRWSQYQRVQPARY
jgi:hypothetical protein